MVMSHGLRSHTMRTYNINSKRNKRVLDGRYHGINTHRDIDHINIIHNRKLKSYRPIGPLTDPSLIIIDNFFNVFIFLTYI